MITIWHNPRCSKSRQALARIEAAGTEFTVRRYLEDAPSLAELEATRTALGHPAVINMMRTGEKMFKEAGLTKSSDEATLMQAMADHPILIERPIVFRDGKAVIARPPETVDQLI